MVTSRVNVLSLKQPVVSGATPGGQRIVDSRHDVALAVCKQQAPDAVGAGLAHRVRFRFGLTAVQALVLMLAHAGDAAHSLSSARVPLRPASR